MKKQKRKIISIVVVLFMIISIFSPLSFKTPVSQVEAANVNATEAEAVGWMNSIVNAGTTINTGGTQCVALFNEYLGAVFGINWQDNYKVDYAYQIFDRNCPYGFSKISGAGNYKVGDIIVFKPNISYGGYQITNGAGHVAVIYSVSGDNVTVVHQNWNGNTVPHKTVMKAGMKAAVKGVIRPSWKVTGCSHTYSGHSMSTEKAPTFDSTGILRFKCSNCGANGDAVEIPALGDANLRPGIYRIQSKIDPNKYVSVTPYECKKQGNIALYSYGVADQEFRVTKNDDSTYTFEYNSFAIDVCGGAPGGNIWLWDSTGHDAQRFYVVPVGDGYCRIVNKCCYHNFDLADGNTADGTNIGAWYHNAGNVNAINDAQCFKFVYVSCFEQEHEWGDLILTKQPTETEEGEYTAYCKYCGKSTTVPAGKKTKEDNGNSGSNSNTGSGSNNSGSNSNNGSGSNSSGNNNSSNNNSGNKSNTSKAKYSNEWVNGKWYNTDGTQTYKGTMEWKCNSNGWWIEDSSGWYPVSCWQKIDGKWYYFCADGYMDYAEYRDGCWLNADGSMDERYTHGKWCADRTGWWYEDDGWYPCNQYLWIDGVEYWFNSNGYCK